MCDLVNLDQGSELFCSVYVSRVQDGSAQGVYVSTGVACAKDIQDGFAP